MPFLNWCTIQDQIKVNLSDFLSEKLNYDYTYLANLFFWSKRHHYRKILPDPQN